MCCKSAAMCRLRLQKSVVSRQMKLPRHGRPYPLSIGAIVVLVYFDIKGDIQQSRILLLPLLLPLRLPGEFLKSAS